ncbi:hypothetical protein FQR65_LT15133 [Abscondita terminalis]|nr:hypothetical protein FQR65_LT15133 [Abscondita terminalis]
MEKYDDFEFFERFWLTKPTMEFFANDYYTFIIFPTNRAHLKVLCNRKYGDGFAGDFVGVLKRHLRVELLIRLASAIGWITTAFTPECTIIMRKCASCPEIL